MDHGLGRLMKLTEPIIIRVIIETQLIGMSQTCLGGVTTVVGGIITIVGGTTMLPGGITMADGTITAVFGIAQTQLGRTTTIATDHGGIMNLFGTIVGGITVGAKQTAQM